MPYCRKCGAQLEDNSRFCHKCGTQVVTFVSAVAVLSSSKTKKSSFSPLIFVLIGIIVVAVLVGVFAFLAFNQLNSNTVNNGNQTNVNKINFNPSSLGNGQANVVVLKPNFVFIGNLADSLFFK